MDELASQPNPVLVTTTSSLGPDINPTLMKHYVQTAIEGLMDEDVAVIAVLPDSLDPMRNSPWPTNVRVERFVPYSALMPHLSAVVTNGGLGTLTWALSYAVPLVIVPFARHDPVIARECENAGVGIRLAVENLTPEQVRLAVRTVLKDPGYRQRAQQVSAEIHRLDPPERTADLIEQLANTRAPVRWQE